MSKNPYQQPESELTAIDAGDGVPVGRPRRRPVGHGWTWIRQAWSLFTPDWWRWVLAFVAAFGTPLLVQSFSDLAGFMFMLVWPVLVAGFLHSAERAWRDERLDLADILAGFRERTAPLVGLGALNLLAAMIIVLLAFGLMYLLLGEFVLFFLQADKLPGEPQGLTRGESLRALAMGIVIASALLIPWTAAYWFAIPLVYFGHCSVLTALKNALIGAALNILPLLLFSFIMLGIYIVTRLPAVMGLEGLSLLLGLLVVAPLLGIAYYVMFRDIFGDA